VGVLRLERGLPNRQGELRPGLGCQRYFSTAISVSARLTDHGYGSDETVAFPGNGLHEARLFGIVAERLPDFADSGVDTVLGVEEDILAPDFFDDLVAADQLAIALHQKGEQVHGNLFELQDTITTSQLVAAAIQLEVSKSC
jgi:hypothetical protein